MNGFGETTLVVTSTAFGLVGTYAGLNFYNVGFAERKNSRTVMAQTFVAAAATSVMWATIGFSLVYSSSNFLLGGFDYAMLRGVMPYVQDGNSIYPAQGSIPKLLFMMHEAIFCITAAILAFGAMFQRIRASAQIVVVVAWSIVVYCPIAHMVWGNGLLSAAGKFPTLDFGGGLVVHTSAGVAALVCALILGKRLPYSEARSRPTLYVTPGDMSLLIFGWLFLMIGKGVHTHGVETNALAAGYLGMAAGSFTWLCIDWLITGRFSAWGIVHGAICGLVCTASACGHVEPMTAMAISACGVVACNFLLKYLETRWIFDRGIHIFCIHGIGGTFGTLAVAICASPAVDGTSRGLLSGNPQQLFGSMMGIAVTWVFTGIGTFVVLYVVNATLGLHPSQEEELEGLDVGIPGYDMNGNWSAL